MCRRGPRGRHGDDQRRAHLRALHPRPGPRGRHRAGRGVAPGAGGGGAGARAGRGAGAPAARADGAPPAGGQPDGAP
ncbi:MAG TPA: hypothetical protein ENK18_12990 [Deltaproteobacteria bacterium]|nr:hypothetical protein [Deltaproteobacteria bacterium]